MAIISLTDVGRYAWQAGIKDRDALAIAISLVPVESGGMRPQGDTHAHNPDPPDNSYGLWQINMIGDLGPARRRQFGLRSNEDLFQPLTNAMAMVAISSGGRNWRPWSSYTSGKYRQFLSAATAAADAVLGNPPSLLEVIEHSPVKPNNQAVVPTDLPPGLGPNYEMRDFYLAGKTMEANLIAAITDAEIDWNMEEAPTVTVTLRDPLGTFRRSQIFKERSVLHVDTIPFELVGASKAGAELKLTFEHVAVTIMRDNIAVRKVAPGTMSRADFVGALVAEEPFLKYMPAPVPKEPVRVEMARGETDPIRLIAEGPDDHEDTWEAIGRLAEEVGWRRFILGRNEVHYGPETWYQFLPPVFTLEEGKNGVLEIDYEWDLGKDVSECSVRARAGRTAVHPGMCVEVVGEGHADGRWVVYGYTRSFFSAEVNIELRRATEPLPEPAADVDKGSIDSLLGIGGEDGGLIFPDFGVPGLEDEPVRTGPYGYQYDPVGNQALAEQPGARALMNHLLRLFPGSTNMGIFANRPNTGNPDQLSVHAEGRAGDTGCRGALGDAIAAYLVRYATLLGIQYIIWNRQRWGPASTPKQRTWQRYGGPNPHVDHVHWELCWQAARGLTDRYLRSMIELSGGPR